jgi:multidrug resistance efflux pump
MPDINDIEKFDESTADFSEQIINKPPGCLLKSGILTTGVVFTALFILASFIRFPDKITSNGIITSEYPALEITSLAKGTVEEIYKKNGDRVTKEEPILFVKNDAKLEDVQTLEKYLKQMNENTASSQFPQLSETLQLGSLQPLYSRLLLTIKELRMIVGQTLVNDQITSLQKEIKNLSVLVQSVERQKDIFQQELNLSKSEVARTKQLFERGIESKQATELAETKMLQIEQKIEAMNEDIVRHQIRADQLEVEKLRLQNDRSVGIGGNKFKVAEQISNLKTALNSWKKQYVLTAPAEGELNLNSDIVPNQMLDIDQSIGFVISKKQNNQKLIKALCPSERIGKIAKGNAANIKFIGYPHKEFGVLVSEVAYVSPIPIKSADKQMMYEVKLLIPDSIVTTYNKTIAYKPNSSVQVEIITEDRTILDRIFNQLYSLMKN